MIRLGLIGCGEHAESGHAIPLARFLAEHPGEIELAAACDVQFERAQNFCSKYGFRNAYRSAPEMFRQERLDGCIAVVPPQHIAAVGIDLLQKGIPCVVEKPLGTSVAEVEQLVDAAAATGTRNMVSVNRRFMPFLNRGLEWARSVGELRYLRCTMTRHARSEPDFIWTTAIHGIDALRYIAGDVVESKVQLMPSATGASWYGINLRFGGGVCGRMDVLPTTGALDETYDLFGEGFQASVSSPFGRQRVLRGFHNQKLVLEVVADDDTPEDVVNGSYAEATEFIRALRQGDAPRPSIQEVAPSVQLALLMARNMKETK
ncbi:MAG: Gfo/Idh/MocA family oxidoreductase [Acidobacteria bacterium]|nr:Gfo/Idh/MocA family oxidoreductase [Acidobacteriota bacterium]